MNVIEKVEQLIEKVKDSQLPDWDDDSPIIMSDRTYTDNRVHWEITEKGTFRYVIDTTGSNLQGLLCSGNAIGILMGLRPEILPFLPKIRQVYVPDGIAYTECFFMVNCERVRFPSSLVRKPNLAALPRVKEMDMSADIYAQLPDYYCSAMYGLEKVTLSPLTTVIPQRCFAQNYSLKEINLENVTQFGVAAFMEDFGLNAPIVFNAGLTNIANQAFYRTGLTSITFQTPIDGVCPTMSNLAFGQTYMLTEIVIPSGWNTSLYFSDSPLTQEVLHAMIENLADMTGQTAPTFQIGNNNIAKLDEEHIAMLNNKNWLYK